MKDKMAPVCVARHLSLPVLYVFVLCVSLVALNVNSLLVYNRQTLLDLRPYAEDLGKLDHGGRENLPLAPGEDPCSPLPHPGPTFSA